MRRILAVLAVLSIGLVLLAACDTDKAQEQARASAACSSPAARLNTAPTLPGNFPAPGGIVYTSTKVEGPSTVVAGYVNSDIRDVNDAFVSGFPRAGFTITHKEFDGPDAEVNWSGAGTTGQVKLVAVCSGRTSVTLTIRPA